jgi:GNAT superfamily N-acetyltransferase
MGAVVLTWEPALSDAPIRALPPNEAARRLDELAALLVDAVESGASVNFMRGLTPDQAAGFWRGQLPGLADGSRILMAAEAGGRVVGTAMVTFAHQPNQPHRADITKMLVHSSLRRQGLGARLLAAAEAAARAAGRTLLVLDACPAFERELLCRASSEISAAQEQMLLLGRKTARERIASFLKAVSARTERLGAPADLIHLPMTRTDIADYLGLTTETVSRVFTNLRRQGRIHLAGSGDVRLVDPVGLAAIAEGHDRRA